MPRRRERFETRDLTGILPPSVRASVLNISLDGLAVETLEALKPDRGYVIQLGDGPESLILQGTVKWCHLQGTRREDGRSLEAFFDSGVALELSGVGHHILPLVEKHAVLEMPEDTKGVLHIERVEITVDLAIRKVARGYLEVESPLPVEEGARGRVTMSIRGEERSLPVRVCRVRDLGAGDAELLYALDLELLEPSSRLRDLIRDELAEKLWPATTPAVATPERASRPSVRLRGNPTSKLFHARGCRHFEASSVELSSREEALNEGYRPAKDCDP